ncbi:MAG: HD domain-containing phosphohydrolase [Planctomycetota bacterium]
MTQALTILTDSTLHEGLREQLRSMGLAIIGTSEDGRVRWPRGADADWLVRLLLSARVVPEALLACAAAWSEFDEPLPREVIPGIWFIPQPVRIRRERFGYFVAIMVTDALLDDEYLHLMAQAAQFDLEWVRDQLRRLPVVSTCEAQRIAQFVTVILRNHAQQQIESTQMEQMSQQLTESYEEITLLYTIADLLRQIDQPERFVRVICDELLATLPYDWVGALFTDDLSKVPSLTQQLILAGDAAAPTPTVRALLNTLYRGSEPDTTRVLDPDFRDTDAGFSPLGQPVIAHPLSDADGMIGIIAAGNRDGDDHLASSVDTKLLEATARQIGVFLQNAGLFEDLNRMFVGTLEGLTAAIDAKDRYTSGHSQRVAHLTEQLGRSLGLDDRTVRRYRIAGLVHDVGKIGVPESVLTKTGRLDDEEFDAIKKHPEIGHRILRDIPRLDDVLPGVLYHHERWDGAGYPAGLAGDDIPVVARLIGLADAFDAMSSTRTYRASMSRSEVHAEIRRNAGTQFDPRIVETFLGLDFTVYDAMVRDEQRLADEAAGEAGRAA